MQNSASCCAPFMKTDQNHTIPHETQAQVRSTGAFRGPLHAMPRLIGSARAVQERLLKQTHPLPPCELAKPRFIKRSVPGATGTSRSDRHRTGLGLNVLGSNDCSPTMLNMLNVTSPKKTLGFLDGVRPECRLINQYDNSVPQIKNNYIYYLGVQI